MDQIIKDIIEIIQAIGLIQGIEEDIMMTLGIQLPGLGDLHHLEEILHLEVHPVVHILEDLPVVEEALVVAEQEEVFKECKCTDI